VTPYLGGGVGISRNKMGTTTKTTPGQAIAGLNSNTLSHFSYKLAA